jgi:zinc transporter, ZIP family
MRPPASALGEVASRLTSRPYLWLLVPAVLLALAIAFLLIGRPLDPLTGSAPPVEELSVEQVRLSDGLIAVRVRADGSAPVSIAQVQVDGAYRVFEMEPAGSIPRLGAATIRIPYPWVDGEAHHLKFVTREGEVFEHTIDVAVTTPVMSGEILWRLAIVGLFLGLVPVAIGMLTYPAMRQIGAGGYQFVLAFTVGLLAYLFVDTISHGLEAGGAALGRLRAQSLVWASGLVAFLALLAVGRRQGEAPEGLRLAFFIALGIGLHNLGEGLAVGGSLAAGEASLAAFLVIGFALHNLSEGVAIVAPLARRAVRLLAFAGLAALAGLPALAGVLVGAQSASPLWVALCFGIGAGAIAQVIFEVTGLMLRRGGSDGLARAPALSGIALGVVVMYATALLV